jgi:hypothetical protein
LDVASTPKVPIVKHLFHYYRWLPAGCTTDLRNYNHGNKSLTTTFEEVVPILLAAMLNNVTTNRWEKGYQLF